MWGRVTTAKPKEFDIIAEDIDFNVKYTDIPIIKPQLEKSKGYFPEIDLFIWYLKGKVVGKNIDDTQTAKGRAYSSVDNLPYLIILTEDASQRLAAHELGHILNYSNIAGNKNDPDPIEDDPGHNINSNNLMHPTVPNNDINITPEQCEQFFNSTIIQQ